MNINRLFCSSNLNFYGENTSKIRCVDFVMTLQGTLKCLYEISASADTRRSLAQR